MYTSVNPEAIASLYEMVKPSGSSFTHLGLPWSLWRIISAPWSHPPHERRSFNNMNYFLSVHKRWGSRGRQRKNVLIYVYARRWTEHEWLKTYSENVVIIDETKQASSVEPCTLFCQNKIFSGFGFFKFFLLQKSEFSDEYLWCFWKNEKMKNRSTFQHWKSDANGSNEIC